MASHMRSMICLLSLGRDALLSGAKRGVSVESRRYVRGLRRKPVKVLFPENETEKSATKQPTTAARREERGAKVTLRAGFPQESLQAKQKSSPQSSTKFAAAQDQLDGLHIEKAFPGDKRLARLVSVARSRTFREHQGKIVLEGRRLICDALNAGAKPQTVFFSTVERLRELPLDQLRRAALIKVKFEDIKLWSDVVAPQGVIAIFSRPDPSRLKFTDAGHSVPLSLICDNIRDPGNLGTMLRCAVAAGCHNVLLTKGCVDVWEPKVLRAAMGAHFRLPIYPSLSWNDIENHLPKAVTVFVADSSSRSPESSTETKPSKVGDYGWVSARPNRHNRRHEEYDSDSDSDSEDEGLSLPRVDIRLYHENWAQSPSALVIGGETHGLSLEAVELAEKTAGQRLFIPIVPDVDSLNSAMAASILLFEGRKQLLRLMQAAGKKSKSKAEHRFT